MADELPAADATFDTVILGFFLYLCDREDLFKVASEVDRVLEDGGYVFVYDFFSPVPYRNAYMHKNGLFSYKMDYSALFRWNPAYTLIRHVTFTHGGGAGIHDPDARLAVTVMRKCLATAYPENPFSD